MIKIPEDFFHLDSLNQRVQEVVMPLVAGKNDNYYPLGTGFLVSSNGLMITAAHVIKKAYSDITGRYPGSGKFKIDGELYALYISGEDQEKDKYIVEGYLWPIGKAWYSDQLDIGFCWLEATFKGGKSITLPTVRLSPGIPKVGQKVLGFGYYEMKPQDLNSQDNRITIKGKDFGFNQKAVFSAGKIIDVYPRGRDVGMLSFPVFHLDSRFEPGMSGGPVFNEYGFVCGVICSSMPPVEEDPKYISHASLIWPVLGTKIEVIPKRGLPPGEIRFIELLKKGFVRADNTLNTIDVLENTDGTVAVTVLTDNVGT